MPGNFPICGIDKTSVDALNPPPTPLNVTLSITNICQQRCRFCYYDHETAQRHPVYIPLETIQRMSWLRHTQNIVVCGNGEALMHPQYVQIIKTIRNLALSSKIMLYTNGVSLFGEKLVATLENVNSIHISQNAATKEAYDAVIYKGNYKRAMLNLSLLSQLRPPHIQVQLSMIVCRRESTLSDIKNFIRLVAEKNFQTAIIAQYVQPLKKFSYSLPDSSIYNINFEDIYKELVQYATYKKVHLIFKTNITSNIEKCFAPFTDVLMTIDEMGRRILNYCCYGKANIILKDDDVYNLDKIWHNERVAFIRKTINNKFELWQNKMCLACRLVDRMLCKEKRDIAYTSLGLDTKTTYMYGVGFEELHI